MIARTPSEAASRWAERHRRMDDAAVDAYRSSRLRGILFVLALAALGFGTSIKPLMFAICAAVILVTSAFAGISGASHKPKKRRKF